MTVATEAQLRAFAGPLLKDEQRVLAVRTDATWAGPEVITTPAGAVRVAACASPLAVREAMSDHERRVADGAKERLAVLTPCSEHDLGLDVVARLVGGRVRQLDPWSTVQAMFDAKALDPVLVRDHRWLIDDLIALAPGDGYLPFRPLSGLLDLDTAWRAYHLVRFGHAEQPASLEALLAAAGTAAVGTALATLTPERRAIVADRWRHDRHDPVPTILDLAAGDHRNDLVPIGLVLRLVADEPTDAREVAEVVAARVRLEPHIGRDGVTSAGALRWAAAAEAAVDGAAPLDRAAWLDRAEALVDEIGGRRFAHRSRVLTSSFEQRRERLGHALLAAIADSSPVAIGHAEQELAQVRGHRLAEERTHVVEASNAAVRLARRRTAAPSAEPRSFHAAVELYEAELRWVDRARELLYDGETSPVLAQAYTALLDQLQRERHDHNARFATLLADWSRSVPAVDADVTPIEDVIDDLVAPIAADKPVLLVVFDGLSLPIATRIDEDLAKHGWQGIAHEDHPVWPTVVAALPTVTEVSRASLLVGRLTVGAQSVERDGLTNHPALHAPGAPTPVLYHKGDLIGQGGNALPDAVRAAVADRRTRVVAAVVNSVDDHLARGQMVRVDWTVDAIRPLGWLLDAAAEADRTVIVVSDHGHVVDHGMQFVRADEAAGERGRRASPAPGEGEIEVRGPRVLLGDGAGVMPWSERLCYGATKHGYHGGATPQEVLVPFGVYVRAGRVPEGWVPFAPLPPAWWSGAAPVGAVPAVAAAPVKGKRKKVDTDATPSLFPDTGGWLDELLESATYKRQAKRNPRRRVGDARVRVLLSALVAAGGTATFDALAAAVGTPAVRLRGEMTVLRQLLNDDGYDVLADDQGTLRLDRSLLKTQFGVEIR